MAKSIFIASSQEAKGLAQKIEEALAAEGFVPRSWWGSFSAGTITISQLRKLTTEVDGAICIFSADDRNWSRSVEADSPRDNVLLEYGLFLARLNLQSCLVMAGAGVRIPSDLNGLSMISIGQDAEAAVRACVRHFRQLFSARLAEPEASDITIVVDPVAAAVETLERIPGDYVLRNCYLGTEGARSWMSLSRDSVYESDAQSQGNLASIENLIAPHAAQLDCVVSLGPGDGQLDSAMLSSVSAHAPTVQYIPVDINGPILHKTVAVMRDVVSVPVGIQSDFESRFPFIARVLKKHLRGKTLYSMLGNTFGNFDVNESIFLSQLSACANGADLLLLDVAASKGNEMGISVAGLSASMRSFLGNGIAIARGMPKSEVIAQFDQMCRMEISAGRSIISGTTTIRVFDAKTRRAYGYFRRYDEENLLGHFRQASSKWMPLQHLRVETSGPYANLFILLQRI